LVLLWGYLAFSEFPDSLALFGIVLIAVGGLVVWLDGKRQVRLKSKRELKNADRSATR